MAKKFFIKKVCTDQLRPQHSYKLDKYFEDFVHKYILKPYNLIINGDWIIMVSIMIFKKDPNNVQGINFFEPTTVDEEMVKFYPVAVCMEDIYADNRPLENLVGLYYQIISLFFLTMYPDIPEDYLLQLKEKIDWDYLLSLPYPAPYAEQRYVGDV